MLFERKQVKYFIIQGGFHPTRDDYKHLSGEFG
jgi:hypothetical protein